MSFLTNKITFDEAKKAMLSGKDAYEVILEAEKREEPNWRGSFFRDTVNYSYCQVFPPDIYFHPPTGAEVSSVTP